MVLDTQRADRLSCYGYSLETTPNLDQFSKISTMFEHAIAPAQWTVPTHASIFTGLYPSEHTLFQMEHALPEEIETLAERLGAVGYKTVGFSHNPLVGQITNKLCKGFHQFRNYNYLGASLLTYQLSVEKANASLSVLLRRKMRSYAAEFLGYSKNRRFHQLSQYVFPLWHGLLDVSGKSKYRQIRSSLQAAVKEIENHSIGQHKKPVFTFINLMGAHVPYAPPSWALNRFLSKSMRKNVNNLLRNVNKWQVDVRNWLAMDNLPLAEGQEILNAFYDAEVAAQDAEVGWFLNQLTQKGLLKNTMVVIVADHGDHLGEKERLNHAFGVYRELTNVPLLIYDPSGDFSHGAVKHEPVSTRRIFHSIVSAAAVANQKEHQLSLANETSVKNELPVSEGMPLNWAIARLERLQPGIVSTHGYKSPSLAIFDDKYKFILQGEKMELYDFINDISETNNLYKSEPKRVADLRLQLGHLKKRFEQLTNNNRSEQDDEVILAHLRALGYID